MERGHRVNGDGNRGRSGREREGEEAMNKKAEGSKEHLTGNKRTQSDSKENNTLNEFQLLAG